MTVTALMSKKPRWRHRTFCRQRVSNNPHSPLSSRFQITVILGSNAADLIASDADESFTTDGIVVIFTLLAVNLLVREREFELAKSKRSME